jgi:hypothetical protein
VINQESQICPAYLVKLDSRRASSLLDSWTRMRQDPVSLSSGGISNTGFSSSNDLIVPLIEM